MIDYSFYILIAYISALIGFIALFVFSYKDFFISKNQIRDLEKITSLSNEVRSEYEDLRRQRLEAFMTGFGTISLKLKEMYQENTCE